jgi:hypothetical protein
MVYTVMDAAVPPLTLPPAAQAVAGYIGGRATHTWTLAEWLRFSRVPQFPIWVADLGQSPALEAGAAVEAMLHRGWAKMPEPGTRALVVDMENLADPAWYGAFALVVKRNGMTPVCYGSASTVFDNNPAAVWSAQWDNIPDVLDGEHGHQYRANVAYEGTQVDYSVFDAWLFARAGVGPRKGA